MTKIERIEVMMQADKTKGNKRLTLGKNILIPESVVLKEAPNKIEHHTTHYKCLIPIGSDHTAMLIIDEESLLELQRVNGDVSIF